jgi:hypothetical protein
MGMIRITALALAATASLALAACGGGGGEACANAAAADKTVYNFREDLKAAKTSGKMPADKLAALEKKLADATKPGDAVPGGNIKEACPVFVELRDEFGLPAR